MRVLHFFKTYWPETFGGAERVIDAIAVSTSDLGVEHHILSINDDGISQQSHFHGQTLHKAARSFEIMSTDFSLAAYRQYRDMAATADVIHLHFPWPFVDLAHLAARPNKPTVVTYHSDALGNALVETLYGPLRHRFLSRVNRIVATSHNYVRSSPVLQRYQDRIEVIPLGLNPESYPQPTAEALDKWRDRFGTDFFLFVGVLRHYKGLNTLLEAASQLSQPVVIAGAGKQEAEYRERCEALDLSNVHFVGAINDADKVALIKLCTAFVLPSNKRSEAFGLSLAEAAMMGKPMISCEIGTGTSYVNRDGVTGIVVRPNEPRELAVAMDSLSRDPDRAQSLGAAAAIHFNDKLHAAEMGRSYHALYRRVIGEEAV